MCQEHINVIIHPCLWDVKPATVGYRIKWTTNTDAQENNKYVHCIWTYIFHIPSGCYRNTRSIVCSVHLIEFRSIQCCKAKIQFKSIYKRLKEQNYACVCVPVCWKNLGTSISKAVTLVSHLSCILKCMQVLNSSLFK